MRDSEIEQWVLQVIRSKNRDDLKEVCVYCESGVVVLKGTVSSRATKLTAQTAAAQAMGVTAVINRLVHRTAALKKRRANVESQAARPSVKPLPQFQTENLLRVGARTN